MERQPLIRTTHPYGFRTGEWARITGIERLSGTERNGLSGICYMVEFIDGVQDFWAIEDAAARYEFK